MTKLMMHARHVSTAVAIGALFAGSVSAQTTSGRDSTMRVSRAMRSVCRVTPVKIAASDTAYTLRTNSATADSTRLTAAGAKVRCRPARANLTTGTAGGDVALGRNTTRGTSSMRIPVSKEVGVGPATAPVDTPMTPAPAPEPAPVVADSAVPMTAAPEPTPEPAPMPMPVKHYGNFYIGLGTGAGIPTGTIRNGYDAGVAVAVPIGWDSPTGPLGFRVDLGYQRLVARTTFRNTGLPVAPALVVPGTATVAATDPQMWSALANVKLRLPFAGHFAGPTSGLYVVGGGGTNYIRHFNTSFALTNPEFINTAPIAAPESQWRGALDAGGGVSWAFRATEVFAESRYVTTFTNGRHASYVPIIVGLAVR